MFLRHRPASHQEPATKEKSRHLLEHNLPALLCRPFRQLPSPASQRFRQNSNASSSGAPPRRQPASLLRRFSARRATPTKARLPDPLLLILLAQGAPLSEYSLRLIGSDIEHLIRRMLYDGEIKYNMNASVLNFSMGKPRVKFNSSQIQNVQ
ncbi:hypothetical protein KSP39_PZI009866 [Platanthera zijinensis]|uniref:NAD(P)H-quinone oxidoreductase subunit M, chloroplastic n=1 Tax=Platanthera zijinensis TaxID=2320716 RepID=A0AAP0BM08_9ASPA